MHCIYCQHETRVISTRTSRDEQNVYRRRECLECASRFSTQEHLRHDLGSENARTHAELRTGV